MYRNKPIRLLLLLSVFALLLAGVSACGETEEPTPTAAPPPTATSAPTVEATEVFESPILPTPTIAPLALEPGTGGAKGIIVATPTSWDGRALYVYFAPFYPSDNQDEGIFVLDTGTHPFTEASPGGAFQLGTIPPGQYVVVIGPTPEEGLAIPGEDRPRVFEIVAGEILEIGEIEFSQ